MREIAQVSEKKELFLNAYIFTIFENECMVNGINDYIKKVNHTRELPSSLSTRDSTMSFSYSYPISFSIHNSFPRCPNDIQ